MRDVGRWFLAGFRVVMVFVVYAGFGIIGLVLKYASFLSPRRRRLYIVRFTRLWAECSRAIFNIRIKFTGDPQVPAGSLLVSNHVGTPDIFVLGSCFPAFFVSKAEISQWPLFNLMARLGDTIFAEREKRHQVQEVVEKIHERLEQGFSVILFPEAQATDGRDVIPFKSSPFEAAVRAGAPVVPVTVVYHDGNTPSIACWWNETFVSHIVRLLKNPRLDVTVHIARPITGETDRRRLAEESRKIIRDKLMKERGITANPGWPFEKNLV